MSATTNGVCPNFFARSPPSPCRASRDALLDGEGGTTLVYSLCSTLLQTLFLHVFFLWSRSFSSDISSTILHPSWDTSSKTEHFALPLLLLSLYGRSCRQGKATWKCPSTCCRIPSIILRVLLSSTDGQTLVSISVFWKSVFHSLSSCWCYSSLRVSHSNGILESFW